MSDTFCALQSLDIDEPIAGTAKDATDKWVLLQYQGHWPRKIYPEAEFSGDVRKALDEVLALEGSRIQFLRRPTLEVGPGVSLYLVRSAGDDPVIYEFQLSATADLLDIDLKGLLTGSADLPSARRTEPLYLVCTHGTRDKCCAKWGTELYRALKAQVGEDLWQCSHVGGHRFAANMLYFPRGIAYGRLRGDDIEDLLAAHDEENLVGLEFYRGRTCYESYEQAAESFARQKTGALALDATEIRDAQKKSEKRWVVDVAIGDVLYEVEVERKDLGTDQFKSCADEEPKRAYGFVLVRHEAKDEES